MSLGAKVASNLPYLRRYARALTGSQQTGDAFVRATLEAALADASLRSQIGEGRVALYRAFNKVWSSAFVDTVVHSGAISPGQKASAFTRPPRRNASHRSRPPTVRRCCW
jgi:DNA-directed RNA polymerase specialized sigma24 family protein